MEERDRERAVVDALRTHLEKWWGSCDELVWEHGPMRLDCAEFRVLRAARKDDGLWLYASAGASALRQVEGPGTSSSWSRRLRARNSSSSSPSLRITPSSAGTKECTRATRSTLGGPGSRARSVTTSTCRPPTCCRPS